MAIFNEDRSDGDNKKSKFDGSDKIQNHVEMVWRKYQQKMSKTKYQITTKRSGQNTRNQLIFCLSDFCPTVGQ